ncbi:MAG: peptidylprolyl isomerase, partial [Oscillibacter sp.]|nr:peptidylprolyl isomerase [Oscillibacter sp.]
DLADWLYDADRKDGDSAVIPSGENFYVAVFQGRHRDETKTVDIRHILITPEDGELSEGSEGYEEEQARLKEAAKAKAEEIYQQWKDGDATEESFGELARENTADSNGEQGGLYEKVYQGQMVQTFNDWCFDPARQSGDTGIVETEYGFHIMYYVGDDVPRWQAQVEADVKANDFEEWTKSLYADADITRHDFGMSFV